MLLSARKRLSANRPSNNWAQICISIWFQIFVPFNETVLFHRKNVFPFPCMTGDPIKNMVEQGQCRQFGYLSIRESFASHVTVIPCITAQTMRNLTLFSQCGTSTLWQINSCQNWVSRAQDSTHRIYVFF